jgi:arginyl-tRNA synthetase
MKQYIHALFSDILGQMFTDGKLSVLPSVEITNPEPQFGDYATNIALKLAKPLAQSPKDVAENLAMQLKEFDTKNHFSEIVAVNGFINFTVSKQSLLANVQRVIEQGELYGGSVYGNGEKVILEYFQNNVAKPPHVGHLRSAVIGDSLLRIMRFQGFNCISDTHIGDWGTQFGILLHAFKTMGDKAVIEQDPITELNKLYVAMSAKIEEDPEQRELGKAEFKKLEDGDPENRELWQWFVKVSMDDFELYKKLLNLLPFDYNLGESFYEDSMPHVLEELRAKNLVVTGETGEQYVDLEEHGLGRCILIKSDGATTYHLRDFATYIYRKKEFDFYRNLYIVDNRQAHHFNQLFKVLELAGYPAYQDSRHVDFGFMSLPEGAISTRKGTTVSLSNLIEEAKKRALAIIEEKNPTLEHKDGVAEQVGLAAIKYFDLSHNRRTEIVFTWDSALSFEGNTGPYLQYAHARIHGILRKAEAVPAAIPMDVEITDQESAVLRKLMVFGEVLEVITEEYTPNLLCNYLFELAQHFNSFYQAIPVLQEIDADKKAFRLELVRATAQVINNGLYLLGIDAPEEM